MKQCVYSLLMLLMFSCSYRAVQLKSIKTVQLKQFSSQGITATVLAEIENPNAYKIKVKGNNLDLKIGGTSLGKAAIANKVKLRRKTTQVYPIQLHLNYKNLAKGAMMSLPRLLTRKSVFAEINGQIKGGVFLFSKKFPVHLNKEVNLSKIKMLGK